MNDPRGLNAAAREKVDRANAELARIGSHLLSNEEGKNLLRVLVDMYYDADDLVGRDTHETYRHLGRRDVVKFLLNLRYTAKEH